MLYSIIKTEITTGRIVNRMDTNDADIALDVFDNYCEDIGPHTIEEPVEECKTATSATHIVELKSTHNI